MIAAGRLVLAVGVAALLGGAAAATPPAVELRAPDAVTIDVGTTGAVSLTVVPPGGRSISLDGPFHLDVSVADGLVLPRRRYGRRDAADPAADAPRFDLRVRAASPGDHALRIEARLWLCGKRLCRPVRAERTVIVHAAAP